MCGCGDIKYAGRNHAHSNMYYTKRQVSVLIDAAVEDLQAQIDALQVQIDDCCNGPQPSTFDALWPLAANWTDTSGYSLSFVPQNGASIDTNNGLATFTGAGDKHASLTNAQVNVSDSFTVAMYVEIYGGLAGQTDSYFASWYEYGVNNRAWRLGFKPSGELRFVVSPDGTYSFADNAATGTTILQNAVPHHVAATFDASAQEMKIYLDGNLETTKPVAFSTVYQSTAPLMLAANLENGLVVQNFVGHIWSFRLIHEALTQAEIQALM